MFNDKKVLAVPCVTQPIGLVQTQFQRPKRYVVHRRALLHRRAFLLGQNVQALHEFTAANMHISTRRPTES